MKIKQQKKLMRQQVQKYLQDNKVINLQFIEAKLRTIEKPWYVPKVIWANMIKKIVLDFTSDQI